MPIEIVKTNISLQRRYVPSSASRRRNPQSDTSSGEDGEGHAANTSSPLKKHVLEEVDLSRYESGTEYANEQLQKTMSDIHDIKMYRSVKGKLKFDSNISNPHPPSNSLLPRSGTSERNKRVLVGAEFSRFIVNKEKAKVDRINVINHKFRDPIEKTLQAAQEEMAKNIQETCVLKHRARKMDDHNDPASLANQRKELLLHSEEKRVFGQLHPQMVHTLETPKPTEEHLQFVIDSIHMQEEHQLKKELLQLEHTLRKNLTSSVETDSSGDETRRSQSSSKNKKKTRKLGYLEQQQLLANRKDKPQEISAG